MSEQPGANEPVADRDVIQDLDAAEDADEIRGGRDTADGIPTGRRQYGG